MILDFNYKDLDFISIDHNSIKIDQSRVWANKGHTLGEGMVSPDFKYFYLNIPKNSSSTIKNILSSLGWEFSNIVDYPNAKIIVVLRDPIDRWTSGIFEYLLMYHINTISVLCEPYNYDLWPMMGERLGLSLIFERITFDDHTERQCVFLQNIDLSRCQWLKFDQDFTKTFENFLNTIGYTVDISQFENKNISDGTPGTPGHKKKKAKEFFRYVIANDYFKRYNLEQWFWCDQELINKVKFYDPR